MDTQIIENTDLLIKNGLNWSVNMVQEVHPLTHDPINSWATMRSDNGQILKTGLSKDYTPIQNYQIMALAQKLSNEFDIKTERAEIVDGGKKIILQVTSGEQSIGHTLKNGKPDLVNLRTTFLHDNTGKGALKFTPSPYRLLCKNQLAVISRLDSRWVDQSETRSIYHNKKENDILNNIIGVGQSIKEQTEKTVSLFNRMASTKLTNYDIKDILESMIKEDDLKRESLEIIEQLIFEGDAGQIEPNSAWGLYNGLTRFNNHFSGRKNPSTSNLVFGAIAQRNEKALDYILDYMTV